MTTAEEQIKESIETMQRFLSEIPYIEMAARKVLTALLEGRKVLVCGNGGGAAESQHIAAEIVGRFRKERKGYPAIALTTDTAILTSLSNDYDYSHVFSRQVQALGNKGDALIALSTSGNSLNVLLAAKKARKMGITVIGFTGKEGGELKGLCHVCINVASSNTPRIQECHMMAYHILCEIVDEGLS